MQHSDRDIAAMADHEAHPLGLPRRIEAWVGIHTQGRIDDPQFTLALTVEPLKHAHDWASYTRKGAILFVGEQRYRLTPQQLDLWDAFDQVSAAGNAIDARLRAWPKLVAALHKTSGGMVRMNSHLPRVLLREVKELPADSMTRVNGKVRKLADAPGARWSMQSGHRYFIKI
jgi:hypothetical protein